ncbi:MAG: hypothetical protein AB1806_05515 [Acidobacteriota bacterium]
MNTASVSWGDHLAFGEGDGRLATPDAVARRMDRWRDDLGATSVHWRVLRTSIAGRFQAAPGYAHPSRTRTRDVRWDPFEVVPRLAGQAGLAAYLYVSLFDEGWPLAPPSVRETSFHNAMHGRHVAWQSDFSRRHPEYACTDRSGRVRQWGVLCLAHEAVRAHFIDRFVGWMRDAAFDGLFVCLRSQSRPADHADQFGFNDPVRHDFHARFGRDLLTEDFDPQAWRDLLGEYLTRFVRELRHVLRPLGRRLAVGMPRGDVLGPPLGNTTLDWRRWIAEDLIDEIVVNQDSSRCPSMWHALWPMHRGYGYLQNYVDGRGMPALNEQIARDYGAALAPSAVRLFVAWQWRERDEVEEARIASLAPVSGLVHSTFRYDNPAAVARDDWRA